jgi:ribosomal protein S12 methylthiotransferase RimO
MSIKKLHLVSLGCTKNLVDSEVMLGRLQTYTLTDDAPEADVIIVNTCGFIDAAKEESINTILNLHEVRKNDSLLVMSGCLSERYQEELKADLPEIDIFTGVGDYEKIDELIAAKESRFTPEVYLATEESNRVITGSNYHAYIKIAEGCNQHCSFCAIPSFKGKLHSRTLESIKKELVHLVSQGFYDFSFISQDSSSYGRDLGLEDGLLELIETVEQIEGVKSARILYLYPSTTSFALIDAIADSTIFQTYYDMPIQHINNTMLKTMKRGFGKEKTLALLKHMKTKPNAFIRTSFIVGHPGESDETFEEMATFIEKFTFDRFNTFAYSHEEGTSAYTMDLLDPQKVTDRLEVLEALSTKSTQDALKKLIGKKIDVVIEGESDEHAYLLSARPLHWGVEIDGEVLINDTSDLPITYGKVYEATITKLAGLHPLATLHKAL